MSELAVRPAVPRDAPTIVEIIRAGFAGDRLEMFLYGCHGIARYVHAQIELATSGVDTQFSIATRGGTTIGCLELRCLPDRLFLNYVAVTAESRSGGVANRLLHAAIERAAHTDHRWFALDVLEDNRVALAWYRSLGFRGEHVTEWWEVPNPASELAGGLVTGLPQAMVVLDAFGFSRLTVTTPRAAYEIGILGTRRFRVTQLAALEDPVLLATLHKIDPTRTILALLSGGGMPPTQAERATRVTATERLTIDLHELRAQLSARLR